ENDQTLVHEPTDFLRGNRSRRELAQGDAASEDSESYEQCILSVAEELFDLSGDDLGAVAEIAFDGVADIAAMLGLGFHLRQMNLNDDRLVSRKLARPADNKFLRIAIEIAFPERQGVKRIEKLRDLFDLQRDNGGALLRHSVREPFWSSVRAGVSSPNNAQLGKAAKPPATIINSRVLRLREPRAHQTRRPCAPFAAWR